MDNAENLNIHPILKPLVEACSQRISGLEHSNQQLLEENKKLKENANGVVIDELKREIASLKDKLHLSYGQFESEKELKAFQDFEKEHMHDRKTSKAHGGMSPYIIATGTGVGTIFKAVCPICKASKDITDTSCW